MDFAEVHEIDRIIVPAAGCTSSKSGRTQAEEELVRACENAGCALDFSPKSNLREDSEEKQKSDEAEFNKLAELAAEAETNLGANEPKKEKAEKEKLRTQTFKETNMFDEVSAKSFIPEPADNPADNWISRIIVDLADAIVEELEQTGERRALVADDTHSGKVKSRALFIKVPLTEVKKQATEKSLLTKLLGATTPKRGKDRLLPEPPEGDPNRQKMKVYLLGTPKQLEIVISKQNKVEDIVRHIMTIYTMSDHSKEEPLEFPNDTAAYELRLLEDDADECFMPLYEIAALDKKKRIGEFDVDMVAFCRAKRYTSKPDRSASAAEEEKYKQLEKIAMEQKKMVLRIHCDFEKDNTVLHMIAGPDIQLREVLSKISAKRMEQLRPEMYRFCAYNLANKQKNQMDLLKYSSINNASIFDMRTEVRNLLTTELLLIERLYGDDPSATHKRRSVFAASKTPSDYNKLQKLLDETLMAEKEKNLKKEFNNIYSRYSVTSYDEFDAMSIKANGNKQKVILGIDGVNLYCEREEDLAKSPISHKYNLYKHKRDKPAMLVLPIKSINRVEKAIYDSQKFYLWYDDVHSKNNRIDLETFDAAITNEIIGRIQFVCKKIKSATVLAQSKDLSLI